jgi:ABC-type phosphate transport system auxiliary subunit
MAPTGAPPPELEVWVGDWVWLDVVDVDVSLSVLVDSVVVVGVTGFVVLPDDLPRVKLGA